MMTPSSYTRIVIDAERIAAVNHRKIVSGNRYSEALSAFIPAMFLAFRRQNAADQISNKCPDCG